MKLFVMRHGESMATLDPSLYGRADPEKVPLSEWGYKQSIDSGKALKAYFKKAGISDSDLTVYCSPHQRILQTKDAFLKGFGTNGTVEVLSEPLLAERDHGDFDGLDAHAQEIRNKAIFKKLNHGSSEEKYTTRMPGGESLADVSDRLNVFIEKLADQPSDKVAVIVTHGGNCALLEDKLKNYDAIWIVPQTKIPQTADIIEIDTDFSTPAPSETIIEGRKRPKHLPQDHKAVPHGDWHEAHLLKPEYRVHRFPH